MIREIIQSTSSSVASAAKILAYVFIGLVVSLFLPEKGPIMWLAVGAWLLGLFALMRLR